MHHPWNAHTGCPINIDKTVSVPSDLCKLPLNVFLSAEFQTYMTLFNVFYSFTLFSRHIAEMEAKIEVINNISLNIDFLAYYLGKQFLISSEINNFINILLQYSIIFAKILPIFPKMAIFGWNCLSSCRVMRVFFFETKFPQIFQKTV